MSKFRVLVKGIVQYQDSYLAVERWYDDRIFDPYQWEFIDGEMEFGETPEKAVERIVAEKTGVAVQVNKPLYTWGFTAGEICTCGIAFLCDAQMDEVILAEELRDSKWVPKSEIAQVITNQAVVKDIEKAVKENQRKAKEAAGQENTGAGKAGENSWAIDRADAQENSAAVPSRLRQWPVQIKLVQERASMFAGADLLVAADCTAYAYGNFHQDFIRDHVVLVGCTKLDDIDYSEKLARIFMRNDIKSITVARMEVPCCAGMERAVKMALKESGKKIPVKTVVISTEGEIL